MTAQLSREEIDFIVRSPECYSELESTMARMLLAGMSSEPVILYRERNPYNAMCTGWIELTQDEFGFIKENAGENAEFLRNLIEQDPLVTIDIITHRYYGVGGQWVQDADEYLHMMTAAGIGVKGE
ncbi:hypothetical protein [Citrobacter freundii]|uniref:hypothetical protein n=1 Tax=Citrobacter freundii TaxID=546 RepID=UPI003DA71364